MRLPHKLILLGGVVGIVAFFLPLFQAGYMGAETSFSSLRMVTEGNDLLKPETPKERENLRTFNVVVLVGFGSTALLLLMAILSLGRLGRGAGLLCLAFSIAALGTGILFYVACKETAKESGLNVAGIGITLLMAAGAAGLLGSLGALIKPERKG